MDEAECSMFSLTELNLSDMQSPGAARPSLSVATSDTLCSQLLEPSCLLLFLCVRVSWSYGSLQLCYAGLCSQAISISQSISVIEQIDECRIKKIHFVQHSSEAQCYQHTRHSSFSLLSHLIQSCSAQLCHTDSATYSSAFPRQCTSHISCKVNKAQQLKLRCVCVWWAAAAGERDSCDLPHLKRSRRRRDEAESVRDWLAAL